MLLSMIIYFIIYILIEPVADCTNDYTFNRTKYHDKERGNRHLDGFVDCDAASEGNQYYVEDYDLTNEKDSLNLMSCFKPDGLCLPLTSNSNDGWFYFTFHLEGNNTTIVIHNQNSSFNNFSIVILIAIMII